MAPQPPVDAPATPLTNLEQIDRETTAVNDAVCKLRDLLVQAPEGESDGRPLGFHSQRELDDAKRLIWIFGSGFADHTLREAMKDFAEQDVDSSEDEGDDSVSGGGGGDDDNGDGRSCGSGRNNPKAQDGQTGQDKAGGFNGGGESSNNRGTRGSGNGRQSTSKTPTGNQTKYSANAASDSVLEPLTFVKNAIMGLEEAMSTLTSAQKKTARERLRDCAIEGFVNRLKLVLLPSGDCSDIFQYWTQSVSNSIKSLQNVMHDERFGQVPEDDIKEHAFTSDIVEDLEMISVALARALNGRDLSEPAGGSGQVSTKVSSPAPTKIDQVTESLSSMGLQPGAADAARKLAANKEHPLAVNEKAKGANEGTTVQAQDPGTGNSLTSEAAKGLKAQSEVVNHGSGSV